MGDDEIPAGDPTELAGTATADTESVYAWALDEDGDAEDSPRRFTPRRITTLAVGASLAAILGAAAVAVATLRPGADRAATPATPTSAALPAAPAPATTATPQPRSPTRTPAPPALADADATFLDKLRGFGVPINDSDPMWTVNLGRALCATALDPVSSHRYPRGSHTVSLLTKGLVEADPTLTPQQAFRLSNAAVDHYCPEVRGPSPREIAAMPPEARFLAMVQDRLGITPVDGSLVAGGRQVCELRASGATADQILDAMNSPNPREDEVVIVELATAVFCPQYAGR